MVEIRRTYLNPYSEERKERLMWLFDFLISNIGIEYRIVLSLIQKKYGVSLRTAREYINVIVDGITLKWLNGKLEKLTS